MSYRRRTLGASLHPTTSSMHDEALLRGHVGIDSHRHLEKTQGQQRNEDGEGNFAQPLGLLGEGDSTAVRCWGGHGRIVFGLAPPSICRGCAIGDGHDYLPELNPGGVAVHVVPKVTYDAVPTHSQEPRMSEPPSIVGHPRLS